MAGYQARSAQGSREVQGQPGRHLRAGPCGRPSEQEFGRFTRLQGTSNPNASGVSQASSHLVPLSSPSFTPSGASIPITHLPASRWGNHLCTTFEFTSPSSVYFSKLGGLDQTLTTAPWDQHGHLARANAQYLLNVPGYVILGEDGSCHQIPKKSLDSKTSSTVAHHSSHLGHRQPDPSPETKS